MKTALVHDWLISPVGGAENVLHEIHSLYPSPIYTLVWNQKEFPFSNAEIHTSFIQRLPFNFRAWLPFFPLAIEQFNLTDYDLILSSSHCVAKGVLTHAEQLHICYCHTPMRYAWDLTHDYLAEIGGLKRLLARYFLHRLRAWDLQSAPRVDHYIANSRFVARRIKKIYGRSAEVIYPPVKIDYYSLEEKKEDFYLTSSRLVPYKKIDLIVKAFSQMPKRKLVVIGDGPEASKIRKMATKNIEFLGYQPNDVLRQYLQKAKAFVFAALEDFGILPIEAMACGTPVIALGKGGTAETVIHEKTGLLFESVHDIPFTVERFETLEFNPETIRQHAERFSAARFRSELQSTVSRIRNSQETAKFKL